MITSQIMFLCSSCCVRGPASIKACSAASLYWMELSLLGCKQMLDVVMWRERGLESEKSSYLYIEAFPFISPSFLLQSSQGVVFISGALQCQCHLILICANDSPSSIEDQQSALRFEEQINIYLAQASLAHTVIRYQVTNQAFLSRLWLANVSFRKYSFTGTRQTQACMM